MRATIIVLMCSVIFIGVKCDKDWHLVKNTQVLLEVEMMKKNPIKVGDTIFFKIVMPDTLEIEDKINKRKFREKLDALKEASFGIQCNKFDTLSKQASFEKVYSFYGYSPMSSSILFKNSKPFEAVAFIVLKEKGIYQIVLSKGRLSANKDLEAVIIPSFSANLNPNLELIITYNPDIVNRENKNDIYAFRVE